MIHEFNHSKFKCDPPRTAVFCDTCNRSWLSFENEDKYQQWLESFPDTLTYSEFTIPEGVLSDKFFGDMREFLQ